jgi:DNA-binding MurR/RpiR family transcriptional regulator
VVRFARWLGYDGYPDLQQDLQTLVRQKLAPAERMRRAGRLPNGSGAVFDLVMQAGIDNLRTTQALLKRESSVLAAARMIVDAQQKYVIGLRSSSAAATLLDHYLALIQPNVRLLVHGGPNLFEGMLGVTDKDVAVAFSYARYTRWTVEALEYAKSRGARVVAVTDSHLAPAAQIADITLVVPVASVTFGNSYTGVMLAIDALVAEIFDLDADRSLERLGLLEHAFAGREFFYMNATVPPAARGQSTKA